MTKRRILQILAGLVSAFVVLTGFSVTRYVLAHPNEPLQQNVASWARNKGMGAVVDQLEAWLHNDPPAAAPVDTLALITIPDEELDQPIDTVAPPTTSAPTSAAPQSTTATKKPQSTKTTIPGSGAPAQKTNKIASASCPVAPTTTVAGETTTTSSTTTTTTTTTLPGDTTTTSTTTTTTTTIPVKALDLVPTVQPSIKGEGEWRSLAKVRKTPVIYGTSIRPLWCYGSVVATAATYDPYLFKAGLYNGTEVPGGKGWKNGSRVTGAPLKKLVAAFNGGFRFEHEPGGYKTEGRTVRKLRKGYATFAIRADGFSTVGVFGEDILDDGTWVSLRQNLPPLVHNGESSYARYPKVDWGNDFDNKVYNFRSAVCVRTDGLMMFAAVGKVNIGMLADSLVAMGCKNAMELDINGTWPLFATYSGFGSKNRVGHVIDKRMGDPGRFLSKADKDFIALFDNGVAMPSTTTTVVP